MTNSPDILIADEITAAINAEVFSLPFVAERLYVSDWDIRSELAGDAAQTIGNLQVGVWPAESSGELWERQQFLDSYRTGLSFATRVAKASRSDLDALIDLVDEVRNFLAPKDGPQVVTIPDGRRFINDGWEYLLRFDERRLDRKKTDAGNVEYTGVFGSALVFDFTDLE